MSMPGSSNNSSFIPKRGTKKHTRKIRNINIYLLTVASYILFFAALGASGAAYFYNQTITNELNNEIATMSTAVSNFKEAEMKRVEEFDVRLRQANNRLANSASVTAILSEIESAVVESLRLKQLYIERDSDEYFFVEARAETDNYDSAIFQRDILAEYDTIEELEISDVILEQIENETDESISQGISLVALLAIPLEQVAYKAEAPVSVSEDSQADSAEQSDDTGQVDNVEEEQTDENTDDNSEES